MEKELVSKTWGPHWPALGIEQITRVLAAYGFSYSNVAVEEGFIDWKRPLSELCEFKIGVVPQKAATAKQCGFSGTLFVSSTAAGQIQVDAGARSIEFARTILLVPLAWMVRHAGICDTRYMWEIGLEDPVGSLQTFKREMAQCLPVLLAQLQTEQAIIHFVLNIDSYSKGVKGGPFFRPAELLKVSALYCATGNMIEARNYLDEYYASERANLHRRWGLPSEKQMLDEELTVLEKVVSNLRVRYQ